MWRSRVTGQLQRAKLRRLAFLFILLPPSAQDVPTWRLTHDIQIGAGSQGPQYDFTRIEAILSASDGAVFIADAISRDVRIFAAAGAYESTFGRSGRGPGEFGRLLSAGLLGDTLWVIDSGLRRATLFSRAGEVLATISTAVEATYGPAGQAKRLHYMTALLPGGLAFGTATTGESNASVLPQPEAATPVLLMTRAGRTVDTLAWISTKNAYFASMIDGGIGQVIGRQRFSDAPLTILAPSMSRLFTVDRSVSTAPRTTTFRVVALEAGGDTLWSRNYLYVPRRLEKDSIDSYLASLQRSFARSGSARTPAEIRQIAFIPEYRTPVTSGFAAGDGTLWLRREQGRSIVEYAVIGPDGRLLARLNVPSSVTLMAVAGSKAWGVEVDADDVPHVVRYNIMK
jgi:hypothetical protein